MGQASNSTVETIEDNGPPDSLGGVVEFRRGYALDPAYDQS
jgi:hypothetical protein